MDVEHITKRKKFSKPFSEKEILTMVTANGLTDRQALAILSTIRKIWPDAAITPNIKAIFKKRKLAMSPFFTVKLFEFDESFKEKQPNCKIKMKIREICRWPVFCNNIEGLIEFLAIEQIIGLTLPMLFLLIFEKMI